MMKSRLPVKSAALQYYELFNWAGKVPSFPSSVVPPGRGGGRAPLRLRRGKQGLRFRIKQEIE